jgi:DNA-3-methyladenine glycosylase
MKVLPRSFYRRDPRLVAPELLNKVLWFRREGQLLAGRIVEVEAYAGSEDEASHTFRGLTERNRVMFGPAGHLYVYFTYGMHFCANAVCDEEGVGNAVLLRALEPLRGLEQMQQARGSAARSERDLCSGPAKLCQAFTIDRELDGADLVRGDYGLTVRDDGVEPPEKPATGPRIGISKAVDFPWRCWVKGNPHVSR